MLYIVITKLAGYVVGVFDNHLDAEKCQANCQSDTYICYRNLNQPEFLHTKFSQ